MSSSGHRRRQELLTSSPCACAACGSEGLQAFVEGAQPCVDLVGGDEGLAIVDVPLIADAVAGGEVEVPVMSEGESGLCAAEGIALLRTSVA